MTHDLYEEITDEFLSAVRDLGRAKGKVYANDDVDRLANFKRAGQLLGLDSKTVLMVYASKHWDAISSIVRTDQNDEEGLWSHMADLINYMCLLRGLRHDEEEDEAARDAQLMPSATSPIEGN